MYASHSMIGFTWEITINFQSILHTLPQEAFAQISHLNQVQIMKLWIIDWIFFNIKSKSSPQQIKDDEIRMHPKRGR